jgi:hypothetical protein
MILSSLRDDPLVPMSLGRRRSKLVAASTADQSSNNRKEVDYVRHPHSQVHHRSSVPLERDCLVSARELQSAAAPSISTDDI